MFSNALNIQNKNNNKTQVAIDLTVEIMLNKSHEFE